MKIVAKVLLSDSADNILTLRRNITHPNFPHHIDLPGGEVEPNELPLDAVRREISEETGLIVEPKNLKLVCERQVTQEVKHLLYVGHISSLSPPVVISWEHDNYEWLTLTHFTDLPLPAGVDDYHRTVLQYLTKI